MDEKRRETLLTVIKGIFYVAFALCLGLIVYYNTHDTWSTRITDKLEYIEEWTVIAPDGETFKTGRKYSDERLYEQDFTIISTVPKDVCDDSLLCFANRSNIEVYIDGVLRTSYDKVKDVALPGGAVKSFYMTVPLNESDAGKELKMIRHKTDRRPEVVPETFMSGMGGVYSYMISNFGFTFAMAEILICVSFVVILVGIGMRLWYRQKIDMYYAAFGIFVTAAWVICNSYLYPFAFGHYHIDGIQSYLWCVMIPFGYLLYLDSIQQGRHRRFITVLLIISTANMITWPTLHFLEIFHFSKALEIQDSILALVIVGVFVMVVMDYRQGKAKGYRYTAIGFAVFTVMCMWETVNVLIIKPRNDGIPMVVGLLLLLTFVVLQQVDDLRKISSEKQRAIELSDAKTKFLAGMSHEIRTPINSILGMNEMILRENLDPNIARYAQGVQNSGKMLLSLINDVLDFSKIEAGKLEITHENFSIPTMLSEVSLMVRERAEAKDLTYDVIIGEGVPSGICSDEVRLQQVLINLINNAIKYTDKGGVTLRVSGRYSQDDMYTLRFNVVDTGRGIKKEEQQNLFDAFTRADLKKNRNIEGTGLGLAIVKNIVDSMGGSIEVESEYLKGSDFAVTIPVNIWDKTPIDNNYDMDKGAVERDVERCDFRAPDAKVLAVDDNHSNLSIVELFLKRTGIVPDTCMSGMEAFEKCRTTKYDLILLDHMMPSPDGIETLRLIRNDEVSLNKDTPAIVLTANALAGSRQMYIEAGFADYLTKPLDSRKLEETVKGYIPEEKILSPEDEAQPAAENDRDTDMEGVTMITGMDYEAALENCGGDEGILKAVLAEIADESTERIEKMRGFVEEKKYRDYGINAHAIKGLMLTVGITGLSERAKKHEFAVKEENFAFVNEDYEGFLEEYKQVCDDIRKGS